MTLSTIILAGGNSRRMDFDSPKTMLSLGNKPMICYLTNLAKKLNSSKSILITATNMKEVRQTAEDDYQDILHAIQIEALGTADAVKVGLRYIESESNILVLYGDTPFLTVETIKQLLQKLDANKSAALSVIGFNKKTKNSYGKMLIKEGKLKAIIEDSEATKEERKIELCNSGIMAIKNKYIKELIAKIKNDNSKGEYYLTDIVAIAIDNGFDVEYIIASENEVRGINTMAEYQEAQKQLPKINNNQNI